MNINDIVIFAVMFCAGSGATFIGFIIGLWASGYALSKEHRDYNEKS